MTSICQIGCVFNFSTKPTCAIGCDNLAKSLRLGLDTVTTVDPEWLSPKTPILPSENEVVMRLLASCRYGQHQLNDPEGNLLDVSE